MTTTATKPLHPAVGTAIDLAIVWGSQRRLKCPACKHFVADGPRIRCTCGAVYRRSDDASTYYVEARG